MNKTYKLVALVAIIFTLGIGTAKAQSIIVSWNVCELQVSDSFYYIDVAIYDTYTGTIVFPLQQVAGEIDQSVSQYSCALSGFTCDQMLEQKRYLVFVRVELRKVDDPYCTGEARSSLLTCSELYNDNTALTVNMTY